MWYYLTWLKSNILSLIYKEYLGVSRKSKHPPPKLNKYHEEAVHKVQIIIIIKKNSYVYLHFTRNKDVNI